MRLLNTLRRLVCRRVWVLSIETNHGSALYVCLCVEDMVREAGEFISMELGVTPSEGRRIFRRQEWFDLPEWDHRSHIDFSLEPVL